MCGENNGKNDVLKRLMRFNKREIYFRDVINRDTKI